MEYQFHVKSHYGRARERVIRMNAYFALLGDLDLLKQQVAET
jgi:hypothetical protein